MSAEFEPREQLTDPDIVVLSYLHKGPEWIDALTCIFGQPIVFTHSKVDPQTHHELAYFYIQLPMDEQTDPFETDMYTLTVARDETGVQPFFRVHFISTDPMKRREGYYPDIAELKLNMKDKSLVLPNVTIYSSGHITTKKSIYSPNARL